MHSPPTFGGVLPRTAACYSCDAGLQRIRDTARSTAPSANVNLPRKVQRPLFGHLRGVRTKARLPADRAGNRLWTRRTALSPSGGPPGELGMSTVIVWPF